MNKTIHFAVEIMKNCKPYDQGAVGEDCNFR